MPKHEIPLEEQAMRSPDARNWNGQSALKLLTVESACANLAAIIPGGATSQGGACRVQPSHVVLSTGSP